MIKIKMTKLQIEEISHKLSIVCDEPDLQTSYELSEKDCEEIHTYFHTAKPGLVEFDEKYLDLIVGEIENHLEMLHCNWIDSNDQECGGAYRSMKNLHSKLEKMQ